MRTVPFSSLWRDLAYLVALTPDSLAETDRSRLAAAATDALRAGWEHGAWPEWCPVELLTPTPEWSDTGAYAADTVVWYAPDGYYYKTLGATTAGQSPVTNPELWEKVAAPASPDLRQVFAVYLSDPRDNPKARRTPFLTTPSGVVTPKVSEATPVWVHYRPSAPKLSLAPWDAGTAYSAGRIVYRENDEGEGESYLALVGTLGEDPLATPASWRKQEIPQILEEYIKAKVQAKWLSSAGQYEQAGRIGGEGEFHLVKAYDLALSQTRGLGLP